MQVGDIHGKRTVTAIIERHCMVQCVCGRYDYVRINSLRPGRCESCFNCRSIKVKAKRKSLIGVSFGERTVIDGPDTRGYWLCQCLCGQKDWLSPRYVGKRWHSKCIDCAHNGTGSANTARMQSKLLLGGSRKSSFTILASVLDRSVWYLCLCDCGELQWRCRKQLEVVGTMCTACLYELEMVLVYVPKYKLARRLLKYAEWVVRRNTDSRLSRGVYVHKLWTANSTTLAAYLMTLPGCNNASLTLDRIDTCKGYIPSNLQFVSRGRNNINRRCNAKYQLREVWEYTAVLYRMMYV